MRVRYRGPSVGVDLLGPDDTTLPVKRNHTVDVPDDYGKRLIEQSVWSEVKPAREKPPKSDDKGDE